MGIGAEAPLAPADHRIVGVEIEVDHGAEIEVEAGLCQLVGHRLVEADGAFRRCEARVPADAPRRGEIRVSVAMGEPLHEAALLIDGDEGDRRRLGIAQESGEPAELRLRADILGVKHHAPDHPLGQLVAHGHDARVALIGSGKAHHDHLPDHGVEVAGLGNGIGIGFRLDVEGKDAGRQRNREQEQNRSHQDLRHWRDAKQLHEWVAGWERPSGEKPRAANGGRWPLCSCPKGGGEAGDSMAEAAATCATPCPHLEEFENRATLSGASEASTIG